MRSINSQAKKLSNARRRLEELSRKNKEEDVNYTANTVKISNKTPISEDEAYFSDSQMNDKQGKDIETQQLPGKHSENFVDSGKLSYRNQCSTAEEENNKISSPEVNSDENAISSAEQNFSDNSNIETGDASPSTKPFRLQNTNFLKIDSEETNDSLTSKKMAARASQPSINPAQANIGSRIPNIDLDEKFTNNYIDEDVSYVTGKISSPPAKIKSSDPSRDSFQNHTQLGISPTFNQQPRHHPNPDSLNEYNPSVHKSLGKAAHLNFLSRNLQFSKRSNLSLSHNADTEIAHSESSSIRKAYSPVLVSSQFYTNSSENDNSIQYLVSRKNSSPQPSTLTEVETCKYSEENVLKNSRPRTYTYGQHISNDYTAVNSDELNVNSSYSELAAEITALSGSIKSLFNKLSSTDENCFSDFNSFTNSSNKFYLDYLVSQIRSLKEIVDRKQHNLPDYVKMVSDINKNNHHASSGAPTKNSSFPLLNNNDKNSPLVHMNSPNFTSSSTILNNSDIYNQLILQTNAPVAPKAAELCKKFIDIIENNPRIDTIELNSNQLKLFYEAWLVVVNSKKLNGTITQMLNTFNWEMNEILNDFESLLDIMEKITDDLERKKTNRELRSAERRLNDIHNGCENFLNMYSNLKNNIANTKETMEHIL